MKIFKALSVLKSNKWIPAGRISEPDNKSEKRKVTKIISFEGEEFNTESEANQFFSDYYENSGYRSQD